LAFDKLVILPLKESGEKQKSVAVGSQSVNLMPSGFCNTLFKNWFINNNCKWTALSTVKFQRKQAR